MIHQALSGDAEAFAALSLEQKEIYDACQKIEQREVEKAFGPAWDKARVWKEQRFWVKVKANIAGKEVMLEHSGQPDKVYRLGNRALIIEYKTLAGDVPGSPTNEQGRDQVCLVSGHLLVYEIGFMVIQPLVTHSPELCLYEKEDIDRATQEMCQRVAASNTPDQKRIAGEVQCQFCKAKMLCGEYNAWAGAGVPAMEALITTPVSRWTPEQRGSFMNKYGIAHDWLEACRDEMKKVLAADPNGVTGWGLKDGANNVSIIKPETIFARFSALGGTQEQFMKVINVVKGRLEEETSALTEKRGKALSAVVEKLLEGCTTTTKKAPTLVQVKEGK